MLRGDLNEKEIQKRGDICICIGKSNGTPLQYSCLGNPMDGGARWAAVHGVAEGWTRLKQLSSSSSSSMYTKEELKSLLRKVKEESEKLA